MFLFYYFVLIRVGYYKEYGMGRACRNHEKCDILAEFTVHEPTKCTFSLSLLFIYKFTPTYFSVLTKTRGLAKKNL